MNEETRAAIKQHGISIWLKADIATLLERVAKRGGRPLLEGDDPEPIIVNHLGKKSAGRLLFAFGQRVCAERGARLVLAPADPGVPVLAAGEAASITAARVRVAPAAWTPDPEVRRLH